MSPQEEAINPNGGQKQEEQENKPLSKAPYESVLLKTVEKLRDQLLLFLLGYAVLIVVLAMAGSEIIAELRYLLYGLPVLGVLAYFGLTYLRMRERAGERSAPAPVEEEEAKLHPIADAAPEQASAYDDQIELLLKVREHMSRLLIFARRELLLYPYPVKKRNEEAKYFFNEKSDRLSNQLGELRLLAPPEAVGPGESVHEMFDTLWEMSERGDPRETRKSYLAEIEEAIAWFSQVAADELRAAPRETVRAHKARLGRQIGGKMRNLLTFTDREILPYPHKEQKQNYDAEWYFKEKVEGIAAGLDTISLLAAKETIEQGNEVKRQFDALWTMAVRDEPIEIRVQQQKRITRALERFELLLRQELLASEQE